MIAPAFPPMAYPEIALREAINTKCYGIDVSHWQGVIDWATVALHIDWAIFKATDGWNEYKDLQFPANKAGCIANKIPWGAYHFYQPAFDAIDQAEDFVAYVGDGCQVYVVDVETDYGSGDNWEDLLKDFLDRVEQLTGRKPTIYTSKYYWESFFDPVPSWTGDYPLWVAHWNVQNPLLPDGWTTYVIHQFGDDGVVPGINAEVDEDWFNGDLNACWDYFGFQTPPASIHIRVGNNFRRMVPIFASPNVNSVVLGYAMPSSLWDVELKMPGEDGREYMKMGLSGYLPAALCLEI